MVRVDRHRRNIGCTASVRGKWAGLVGVGMGRVWLLIKGALVGEGRVDEGTVGEDRVVGGKVGDGRLIGSCLGHGPGPWSG